MPCFHPMIAWQTSDGSIGFVERLCKDVVRELQLPCRQCIGCRLERSRQWAMRCMHEASLYGVRNSFVTLTYDDKHLPKRGVLQYEDFQKFMRRLRKHREDEVRFYMCGEYGPLNWRPHYHACLFNTTFDDKEPYGTSPAGSAIYRSAELDRLWSHGFTSVGDINFESAGYVARYCVQKITGDMADAHYRRSDLDGSYLLPCEFNQMSRKPGIGAKFLEKWRTDIYPHDYVIVNGRKMNPPKYYDNLFKAYDPDAFEEMQWLREKAGRNNYADNVPERLSVKEEVTRARAAMLKRNYEC